MGYDTEQIKATADQLLDDEYVRLTLLGFERVEDGQKARDELLALLKEHRCLEKRRALGRVIHAPLAPERIEAMRQAIEESLNDRRWLLNLIRQLGGLEHGASSCIYPGVQWCLSVGKDSFITDGRSAENVHGLFGVDIGAKIGANEDLWLSWALEQRSTARASIHEAGEAAAAVHQAIADLKERGLHPSLILVPPVPRLLDVLLGEDRFGKGKPLGPRRMRPFEGVPVMEWLHKQPASVAVVDVGSFYGDIGLPADMAYLTFMIEERFRKQNLALLEAAESAVDPDQIAEPDDCSVAAVLRLLIGAGIANPHAAIRIKLDPQILADEK
jgi:hypothetical protein